MDEVGELGNGRKLYFRVEGRTIHFNAAAADLMRQALREASASGVVDKAKADALIRKITRATLKTHTQTGERV